MLTNARNTQPDAIPQADNLLGRDVLVMKTDAQSAPPAAFSSAVDNFGTTRSQDAPTDRYRRLIERLPDRCFFFARNRDGCFTFLSPSVAGVLGYAPDELACHYSRLLTASPVNRDGQRHADLSTEGLRQPRFELSVRHRDGSTRNLEVIESPVFDGGGNVVCVEGMAYDITERKAAERQLRRREGVLRAVAYAANSFVHANDWEEHIYSVLERLGEAMEASRVYVFHNAEDPDSPLAASLAHEWPADGSRTAAGRRQLQDLPYDESGFSRWRTLLARGDSVFGLVRDLPKAERTILMSQDILSVAAVPIFAGSEWWGFIGFGDCERERLWTEGDIDVLKAAAGTLGTALKRRDEEAARRRMAEAVENAAEAVMVTDPDGVIQYVNPAFETITGYTRAEAVGSRPSILQSGRHDRSFYERMWHTIRQGHVWRGSLTDTRKDGQTIEVESTISPIHGSSGEIVSYVAVQRDITQELMLENQLRQSQKMEAVGKLAGGVAHDFNNLLMVILNSAQFIKDDLDADIPSQGDLADILDAATRASALTRQLLAFSRRQPLVPKTADLNTIVLGLQRMLARLIGEDVRLHIDVHPDQLLARVDVSQVEQVIFNLVVNARDAMPRGGDLTISAAPTRLDEHDQKLFREITDLRPGPYVTIKVSDTGEGMDENTLAHMFEPFFTTKGPGNGTGLGLSTVYGITRQHGGHVAVQSQPGKGTAVTVYLPELSQQASPKAANNMRSAIPTGTETVLVTEDDEPVRNVGVRMLRKLGYTVLEADSPECALRIARDHAGDIHLLFTDVVMPDMDGITLANELQVIRPGLKVLYASGYPAGLIEQHSFVAGRDVLLRKPFNLDEIAVGMRRVLDDALPS